MPPISPLILPLLGGFLFCITFHHSYAVFQRMEGRRVFFASASAGAVLLGLSALIVNLIAWKLPAFANFFNSLFPYSHLGKSITAFLLGPFLGFTLTFFLRSYWFRCDPLDWVNEKLWDRFYSKHADITEQFLFEKGENLEEICVTLDSEKVYVGFVSNAPMRNPRNSNTYSLGLIPVASGYRDENKNIQLENSYHELFEKVMQDPDREDLNVLIPITKIHSISAFDWEVFMDLRDIEEETEEQLQEMESG